MSKRKHGGDRKSDKAGYLLRFLSDDQKKELEQLAANAGVSLNKFLNGLGDRALAEKRERDAKTARIAAIEQDLRAKEDEIVELLGEMSKSAASRRRDHLVELRQITGWNIERGKDDDANPDPNSARGRIQLEREFERVRRYFLDHHDPNILARPLIATLFAELLKLEDRFSFERYGPNEWEREWADRNAWVKPEFQPKDRDDDDDDDDDDDGDGGGDGGDYYEQDQDNDSDDGDPGDDGNSDSYLD